MWIGYHITVASGESQKALQENNEPAACADVVGHRIPSDQSKIYRCPEVEKSSDLLRESRYQVRSKLSVIA